MKKLISLMIIIALAVSLVACSAIEQNPTGEQGGTQQGGLIGGNGATEPTETKPEPTETRTPDEPFSPYGTWVWVGNDKFTLTLNEDGSAVYADSSDDSYINRYSRLQALYFSTLNNFTYEESEQKVTVNLLVDDRSATVTFKVGVGNGYYILDAGEFDYCFVRAEYYQEAHENFMNAPIYTRWADNTPLEPGQSVDMFPDNEVKLTLNRIEMDSEYNVKVFCTISAKIGISSFDWMQWTLRNKGEGGIRSNCLYFYDLEGNELIGLSDGQSVDGYFTIENVDTEKSMSWFGELQAGVYISGMYSGIGCLIILPTQPNV